jgi:hypothetical protein
MLSQQSSEFLCWYRDCLFGLKKYLIPSKKLLHRLYFIFPCIDGTEISLLVFLPRGGNAAVLAQALDLGLK